jgi:hypothetical protein
MHATFPVHLIFLWYLVGYKLWGSSWCSFLWPDQNILLSIVFWRPQWKWVHRHHKFLQVLVSIAVIATVWKYANAGGHHGGGHGYAHSFAHFHGPVAGPAEPVHVGHGHGHGHAIDYVVSTVDVMFRTINIIALVTRAKTHSTATASNFADVPVLVHYIRLHRQQSICSLLITNVRHVWLYECAVGAMRKKNEIKFWRWWLW